MNMDEIRAAKRELEKRIVELLQQFERDSTVEVARVEVGRHGMQSIVSGAEQLTVSVEVRLQ